MHDSHRRGCASQHFSLLHASGEEGHLSSPAPCSVRTDREVDYPTYVTPSSGLPPGDRELDGLDRAWHSTPYLEVSDELVSASFKRFGVLDGNVVRSTVLFSKARGTVCVCRRLPSRIQVFAKGFFNETMGPLSKRVRKLSVMRLDGHV